MMMGTGLIFAAAQNSTSETVYYQYFNKDGCGDCTQETAYVIDECFETENDFGNLEFGKAIWLVPNVEVQLGFYGNDNTCSHPTGEWAYALDSCYNWAGFSELVSETSNCEGSSGWSIWTTILICALVFAALLGIMFYCCKREPSAPATMYLQPSGGPSYNAVPQQPYAPSVASAPMQSNPPKAVYEGEMVNTAAATPPAYQNTNY